MTDYSQTLAGRFEAFDVDASAFGHQDHVTVAFQMLGQYEFLEAAYRYARSIKEIAARAGAPEKFNATITLAFMGLIAERKANGGHADGLAFVCDNPDLLDRTVLDAWYSRERLNCDQARRQFLLPDRVQPTAPTGELQA